MFFCFGILPVKAEPPVTSPLPQSPSLSLPASLEEEVELPIDLKAPKEEAKESQTSVIAPAHSTSLGINDNSNTNKLLLPLIAQPQSSVTDIQSFRRKRMNQGFLDVPSESLNQITNVNELRDVQPTDWAYEVLRSLVAKYGCIVGYPDRTYRGGKALNRWEFAAGLNACISTIERLLQENVVVLKSDLDTLKRLTEEYRSELAAAGARIDNLESRIAYLEDHQFSTTSYFGGEVIIGLADAGGGNPPGTGKANAVVNYLARFGVVTSFTGKDILRFTISSGNFDNFGFANSSSLNTYAALLSYQDGLKNNAIIDNLEYRFAAFDDNVVFTIKPVGFSLSSVLTGNSPYFDAGRGSLSRFGQVNSLFYIGALDSGLGFDWLIADPIRLQVAYGTRDTGSPEQGITGADHSALGVQLLFKPADTVLAGIHYIDAYSSTGALDTFTGSFNADTSGLILEPSKIYAVGASLQWRILDDLTFSGWGGYVVTHSLKSIEKFSVSNAYSVSLGWSDPFNREGDLLAFIFGQPLTLQAGNGLFFGEDNATAYQYELFYRFKLQDRIDITPGFFMVTHPGSRTENQTIYVGAIRTTFRF
ncbi:MAG: iron uptake porin [Snowella sp.]|nr:iron uptake porin [Snowella sp.]